MAARDCRTANFIYKKSIQLVSTKLLKPPKTVDVREDITPNNHRPSFVTQAPNVKGRFILKYSL